MRQENELPSTTPLRVALVYPPFEDKRDRSAYYIAPPLGLLYIASSLEAAGHAVRVLDFIFEMKSGSLPQDAQIYRECARRVAETEPDVACFSTQCTTSPGSVNIARELRKLCPAVRIVFGGHDVSFIGKLYLERFEFLDFVLGGEAERTAVRLAAAINGDHPIEKIPGLVYRRLDGSVAQVSGAERVADLDTLPLPAYHLVAPMQEYFKRSRVPTILIDSGRGCAFACEFCQTTLLNGPKVRYRTIDSLIHEIKNYRAQYGTFEAYFVHDLFTARRSFVEKLCERLIKEDLQLSWQCRCRLDQVDRDLLGLMSRAGCRMLLYGVESGSEVTLEAMNKRLRPGVAGRTLQVVRETVDAGIFPSLSMVIGIPEESHVDLCRTLAVAHDFVKIGAVNAFIQLMSPLPGTVLAKRLEHRFDYIGAGAPTAFSVGIEFDDGRRLAEDENLITCHADIFQSFQIVVPDHGDIGLCIDVSLAYCKLLEVYCHTVDRLLAIAPVDHLSLFQRWRRYMHERRDRGTLEGIKDYEIWEGFEGFFREQIAQEEQDEVLHEVFRFETLVHQVSVSPVAPVDQAAKRCDTALSLAPSARTFRPRTAMEWLPRSGATGAGAVLLFMSQDRLHVIELTPEIGELVDLLEQPDLPTPARIRVSTALRRHAAPLLKIGAFTSHPAAASATVAGE